MRPRSLPLLGDGLGHPLPCHGAPPVTVITHRVKQIPQHVGNAQASIGTQFWLSRVYCHAYISFSLWRTVGMDLGSGLENAYS